MVSACFQAGFPRFQPDFQRVSAWFSACYPVNTGLHLCWNFGRLVSAHSGGYRDELETPGSHLLGAHFGHQTLQTYKGYRPFKTVLLVILGLLKFVQNSPIEPFKTCHYCPIIVSPALPHRTKQCDAKHFGIGQRRSPRSS